MKTRFISFVLTSALFLGILTPVSAKADEVLKSGDGVVEASVTLAENITLYANLLITDSAADSVEVVLPNAVLNTYKLSEVEVDDNIYLLPAEIFVKNLYDAVHYKVLSESGEVIATYSASVADYCESYKTRWPNGPYIDLIGALEDYGEISARYFAKQAAADTVLDADFSSVADVDFKGKIPNGIKHESATLVLESETTLRHYFLLAEGYSLSEYTFFLDLDDDGKPSDDMPEKLTPVVRGAYCYIEIPSISPNELSNVYKIGVTDGTKTYTCAYGALNYAKNIYTRSTSANSRNLAAAILAYSNAADSFIGAKIPLCSMPESNNANTSVMIGNVDLINAIKQAPENERIITLRVDFTNLYAPGEYLQIITNTGKYKLVQFNESGYCARISTNIAPSASSPKFLKKSVETSYAKRLEIVIDYTVGELRYYMNGVEFFVGAPVTELPAWDTLGNKNGTALFSLTNASSFYAKSIKVYIGNTGK